MEDWNKRRGIAGSLDPGDHARDAVLPTCRKLVIAAERVDAVLSAAASPESNFKTFSRLGIVSAACNNDDGVPLLNARSEVPAAEYRRQWVVS